MVISLTTKERNLAYRKLNDIQKQVLEKWKKTDIRSNFLNDLFAKNPEWDFYDYKESTGYQDSSLPHEKRLFCHCGREVKYQYILQSKTTLELISLSLEHLSEHTGIPYDVAKEIHTGINRIDRYLDETLSLVLQDQGFQIDIIWFVLHSMGHSELSKILQARITEYVSADLPLNESDYSRVVAAKNAERRKQYREIYSNRNKNNTTNKTVQTDNPSKGKNQSGDRYSPSMVNDQKLRNDLLEMLNAKYLFRDSDILVGNLVNLLINEKNYNPQRLIGYVGPTMERLAKDNPSLLLMESRRHYKKISDEKIM